MVFPPESFYPGGIGAEPQERQEGDRMTEFSFYLSEDDTDRLFAIKELQGRHDLTGNEFARLLLENELQRLFPAAPQYDDNGKLLNADRYRAAHS